MSVFVADFDGSNESEILEALKAVIGEVSQNEIPSIEIEEPVKEEYVFSMEELLAD